MKLKHRVRLEGRSGVYVATACCYIDVLNAYHRDLASGEVEYIDYITEIDLWDNYRMRIQDNIL